MGLDRRSFFSTLGGLIPEEKPERFIRPPGSGETSDFTRCQSCEASCIGVCETAIIRMDEAHTPVLDFSQNGCTYCGECISACPNEVLTPDGGAVRMHIAIDPLGCLAWNGTICSSCKDPCRENAIKFLGLYRPEIDISRCTNCGFCIGVCPTDAVKTEGML